MKVNEFHKQISYLYRAKRKISARNGANNLITSYETQKKVERKSSPQSVLQKRENTLENSLMYARFSLFFGKLFAPFFRTVSQAACRAIAEWALFCVPPLTKGG